MSDIVVRLKKLSPDVPDPVYSTDGAAGCDIHSNEEHVLWPNRRHLYRTGLCMEIPDGYECQIRPRSGLALKHSVLVFNSPSTIDSDYRGELGILLINHGSEVVKITHGMRIAQLVFAPVTRAKFETVERLNVSVRDVGGWGSTGH